MSPTSLIIRKLAARFTLEGNVFYAMGALIGEAASHLALLYVMSLATGVPTVSTAGTQTKP